MYTDHNPTITFDSERKTARNIGAIATAFSIVSGVVSGGLLSMFADNKLDLSNNTDLAYASILSTVLTCTFGMAAINKFRKAHKLKCAHYNHTHTLDAPDYQEWNNSQQPS